MLIAVLIESNATILRGNSFRDDDGVVDVRAKEDLICNLQIDHMSCQEESSYYTENEWKEKAITTLKAYEIALDCSPRELAKPVQILFEKFSKLQQQAHAESLWRILTSLEEG